MSAPDIEEVPTCSGCDAPLLPHESMVHLDRHLGVVTEDGRHARRQSAAIILRLCLPCAVANLPRYERAVYDELQQIRREHGLDQTTLSESGVESDGGEPQSPFV